MNHDHAPIKAQLSRLEKMPLNDRSCQRLTSAVARIRVSGTATNRSASTKNRTQLSMAQIGSEGKTNCPFRNPRLPEKRRSRFNSIRLITADLVLRLRGWVTSTRVGTPPSADLQLIGKQSNTGRCECCFHSDRQFGDYPSSLDSVIIACPRLKPHVREAILTLVDAAKLVESGSASDDVVTCCIPNCLGGKHE
jgi:hypothetical protein